MDEGPGISVGGICMDGGCILGFPLGCECDGGIFRGAIEGSEVLEFVLEWCPIDIPMRASTLHGTIGPRNCGGCVGGPGGLFNGTVSARYGCSRHWRLVKRLLGSYFSRSAMHSTNLRGTLRSNIAYMFLGGDYGRFRAAQAMTMIVRTFWNAKPVFRASFTPAGHCPPPLALPFLSTP